MATFGTFTSAVLTAAELNTAGGAWTTFTPSWTSFTLGNGTVNWAKYEQIGRTVTVTVSVTLGSTSSVTGAITLTLPVTASYARTLAGDGYCFDTSASALFYAPITLASTTTARIRVLSTTGTYASHVDSSGTVPMTWTTSDAFEFTIVYEAAADGT